MKRLNKKILILTFVIAWLTLLVFLTPIVLLITGRYINKSAIDVHMTADPVHFAIDNLSYYDDLFKTTTLDGWAFVETLHNNTNKSIKVIFASDEAAYEVDANLHSRQGLVTVFTDKNVPKERTGYSVSFSPLGMRNGEYYLYFYVYENEENFGIINTGKQFKKDYQGFEEIKD